jgi:hypothetical protein
MTAVGQFYSNYLGKQAKERSDMGKETLHSIRGGELGGKDTQGGGKDRYGQDSPFS